MGELRKHNNKSKQKGNYIESDYYSDITNLVRTHYNRHPYLYPLGAESIESICNKNCEEMRNYCMERELHELWAYLFINWYSENWMLKWGRRHPTLVPFAKTTMMAESHWRVVKSRLRTSNRTRVDFVIFLLHSRLMPTVRGDFRRFLAGAQKPRW